MNDPKTSDGTAASDAAVLARAFESSPNAYILLTPDLNIVAVNRAYEAVTGASRDDIVGRAIFEVLDFGCGVEASETVRQVRSREPKTALDAIVGEPILPGARSAQEDNRTLERERSRLVEMFMQAPGFVAILSGPDHRVQMHNDAYGRLIGGRDIAGKPLREALPELAGQGYFDLLDSVFATGEPYEGHETPADLQRAPGAILETVYLNFVYQPIRDGSGAVVGIFVQGNDVTDNVLAAQRQKLMIDELNHRVKNTLATVQSIAIQTARSNTDPARFAETFQSRLMSLSHTHNLLTQSHWEGADLRAILEHETEAYGATRVSLVGPPVSLEPAVVLSLGMIFHELATNAAKYGALHTPGGRVLIDWSLADQRAPKLHLTWREIGGPKVTAPDTRGFGSRLIERNIRHDLAGEIELVYAADGLIAELTLPLDRTAAL